jgi:RND family efflux transporter MFP subunit
LQELQTFKRIVAPFDGVVTQRTAEVGMLVTAGQESLFVVEDTSRVRVQMHVPQTYATQTIPGAEAAVALPESTIAPVEGKITRVADSVEESSRTMLAEIELANDANHFQPGSYARVTIKTQNAEAWTIATNTLQMRVDGPHVAAVNDRNQIEIKSVVLGRDLGSRVVAIAGIQGNERLVVNPGDELVSGVRVETSEPQQVAGAIAQR